MAGNSGSPAGSSMPLESAPIRKSARPEQRGRVDSRSALLVHLWAQILLAPYAASRVGLLSVEVEGRRASVAKKIGVSMRIACFHSFRLLSSRLRGGRMGSVGLGSQVC